MQQIPLSLPTYCQHLLSYDRWANQTVIEKIAPIYDQSEAIAKTMSHVLNAQQIWLSRAKSQSSLVDVWAVHAFEELLPMLEAQIAAWTNFLLSRTDIELITPIVYHNTSGQQFETPVIAMLTQVINHGTHHRAQISQQLRQHGIQPVQLDYIAFSRLN
jgi:uncharacterized damage-inducible protein DinB